MITWEELRRVLSESMGDAYGEFEKDLRRIDQRLASLKQDVQQPRLAMETDIKADQKTRKRTEGAATAVQTKHGDSCSAKTVQVGPKRSTSFDVKAEPLALPCRMTSWSRTALRRQSRVSHPWRCAHQQLPVAYLPYAKPLQRKTQSFTS